MSERSQAACSEAPPTAGAPVGPDGGAVDGSVSSDSSAPTDSGTPATLATPSTLAAEPSAGCGGSAGYPAGTTTEDSLLFGGKKRTFRVHLPPNAGAAPLPVVLAFHGGGGSGGGGGLTQSDISSVVSSRSVAIKRTCYERGNSSANSVNVTAKITVAPSGNVQNVTATGNDGAIAKCIEGQIRTWKFPPPGSTTEITVPFKFVRQ